jgi:peroxiredoxin Q/BCP
LLKKLTQLTCNTANSFGTLLKIKTFIIMLKVGDKIPDLEVIDQNNNALKLSDFKGAKLIVYFYPKDDTPGCTAQACSLRDGYQELLNKGFKLVGVSADTVKKHQSFITKYDLPFPLISDENLALIKAFGVWGLKKFMGKEYEGINRTTFVIDENGLIEHVITKVKTKEHTQQIIDLY